MGKGSKIKTGSFQDINFSDIFETMDHEYLEEIALHDPKQLIRMCTFLTLDAQIRREGLTKTNKTVIPS